MQSSISSSDNRSRRNAVQHRENHLGPENLFTEKHPQMCLNNDLSNSLKYFEMHYLIKIQYPLFLNMILLNRNMYLNS